MINRITPNQITSLKDGEIFVFGSNEAGIHGAGAAKFALDHCGAINGQGTGLQGQSYAIVTKKDFRRVKSSTLEEIKIEVLEFIIFAIEHPEFTFLVTPVGCNLAGFSVEEIAPMFDDAIPIKNIHLPISFWDCLNE